VLCFLDDCQSDWVWWNLNIGFFFFFGGQSILLRGLDMGRG
jgi:hypothetical protein